MLTEDRNPKTSNIDAMSTLQILTTINEEDQLVALAIQKKLAEIARAVDVITHQLDLGGRLFYVGAGTSGRLGILDAVECVPTFGTPPELVQGIMAGGIEAFTRAVEGAEDDTNAAIDDLQVHQVTSRDVIVGIAASGRTPYVIASLEYAQAHAIPTIAIACNDPSPILDVADYPIGIPVGSEIIAGSTRMKAGTAQKMILNMLSTATMIKLGKVYGNLMVDVQITNEKLRQRAIHIITQLTQRTPEQASQLLIASGNHVKTAIVMHHRNVSQQEARQLLDAHKGYLRAIIHDI